MFNEIQTYIRHELFLNSISNVSSAETTEHFFITIKEYHWNLIFLKSLSIARESSIQTLDPDMISNIGLGSLRVYVAATNLLYIMGSDYTSFNPEGVEITNSGYLGPTTYGVQVGASPVVRSFTFGVNARF